MVDDDSKEASFSMDFIIDHPVMYRVYGKIILQESENDRPRVFLDVHNVDIGKNDSYECCSEKRIHILETVMKVLDPSMSSAKL